MNQQSSKKIFFNKSTLFSLKAELLKKQEEVHEKKQLPENKLENFKVPTKVKDEKNVNSIKKKTFKDSLKAVDTEELEACRKAKLALEKKAELYEHLSDSAGKSELAGRFLVDFDTKKQQDIVSVKATNQKSHENDNEPEIKHISNDEDNWMEFTDCLGRTRKCHKSDLDMYIKRDRELMKIMTKDRPMEDNDTLESEDQKNTTEKSLLVQKTNDYLQLLREKWDQKEQELLAKDKDVHYQDLLFDEARIHGVGYYSFSTDETERKKQMEELIKSRQDTLRAQEDAEKIRKKRDELMAARVAAARARQRARAGLPPEEPKENQKDFNTCLLEFLMQQKNEVDAEAKERENKIKEEKEKERRKLREAFVREWDVGKEGVEDKLKKFREMSQEEYVDQQRGKRLDEFAPPQTSSTDRSNNSFDDKGRMMGSVNVSLKNKSWADVRPEVNTPPPPNIGDISENEQKGLYFSTVKKNETCVKYKNFVKAQEPVAIDNELTDDEGIVDNQQSTKRKYENNFTEIAPPPTYDYYGPIPKQIKSQKPFESDIREAYAQGAKSLETKSSNRQLPSHYDFTFD